MAEPCRTSNGCQVRTSFSTCTYDFRWQIKDYPKWPQGRKATSPEFHPINNQAFYATLEIKYDEKYTVPDVTILTFYMKSESDIHIKHTCSLTDGSGQVTAYNISKDYKYSNSTKSCFFPLDTKEIKKFSNSTNDQILIFKCTMEIESEHTEIRENQNLIPDPSDNLSILVANLKYMYTSSLHADINLHVGDGVLRVHKSLLCARSSVFTKMFESPMEENAIVIPDIQLQVLKDLLEFLYTGNLRTDDFESVYALYYAADKYDVSSLRKTCAGVLLSKMDVGNACRVLSLANQHSDVQFENSAIDFVQFHFDEIGGTEAWEDFLEEVGCHEVS